MIVTFPLWRYWPVVTLQIQTQCFAECAKIFHKGGARLILCGKSWEKLETLSEQLANDCDPTLVSHPHRYLFTLATLW